MSNTPGTLVQSGITVLDLPGDWPRFRGAKSNNISSEKIPLARDWAPQGPKVLWSVNLGEGYAAAAVLAGRVYVLDYDQAAQADTLRCFSLADGREVWRRSYPVPIKRNHGMSRTVPAVTPNYIVTLGPKCHVLCADPITGAVRWQHDLVREFDTTVPEWYAGQCPLIDGDRAILAPGGKALIIAVDLASGKVVWQTPNPQGWEMTHSSIMPMTFKGQRMYVYCASGGVVGVSAKDGALLWQTTEWTINTATIPSPVPIGDGRIFLSGGYNAGSIMLQLEEQGGRFAVQTLFRLPPSVFGADQQTPIFYKGYIYGVIPGGQLVCLDLNGRQVWSSGNLHRFGTGPYLIADGMIYLMNDTGTLTLAEATPAGYHPLAQARILAGREAWGPLAIAGGRLIARDLTRMVCIDIAKH
ncbi:MAG: PQQ-like beta-propeller repeat protein [Armatimonadetes bacterium]|nr:PQQ-like beta-propeller repeat protein [Armatimonadota bacterium]